MKRITLLLAILFCLACKNHQPSAIINIKLIDSGHSLQIAGIDPLILNEIARDSTNNWQALFAVYKLPADTDLKDYQPEQPGRYRVVDSAVTFIPDTPFTKQQTYFLRYYRYGDNKNPWDFIKGKSRPGQVHYTDITFKPKN